MPLEEGSLAPLHPNGAAGRKRAQMLGLDVCVSRRVLVGTVLPGSSWKEERTSWLVRSEAQWPGLLFLGCPHHLLRTVASQPSYVVWREPVFLSCNTTAFYKDNFQDFAIFTDPPNSAHVPPLSVGPSEECLLQRINQICVG